MTGHIEERDLSASSRIMIMLRVICVGAVLSVFAFLTGVGFNIKHVLPIVGLLVVVFPLSALWWLAFKSHCCLRRLVYSQLIADLIVVSGIVYFTGGIHSQLAVLFLIIIFAAGILLSLRGALLAAVLSVLLFGAVSLLRGAHLEETVGAPSRGQAMTYLVLTVVLHAGLFCLVAMLSGYVSRRVTIFGARLRSTTCELERTRLDTQQIIEFMNSGLITVDAERVIREFNRSASRILRIEPVKVKGRELLGALGPICPDLCQRLTDALERGEGQERLEIAASTSDGEIPLGVSISVMWDREGKPTGAVSVFQDLTEVKNMSERIRLADRLAALGELSAAVAHEIRTPLASICGSVEMLRDSLKASGDDGRLVDLVVRESDRLRKIVDHFLEFARSRPARFKRASLNSILNEVVCLVKNQSDFDGRVVIQFEPDSEVEAYVDEETIKQVFYNLALNSIEAIDDAGELRITLGLAGAEVSGHFAKVAFTDTGGGIEPGDLNRICQPFFTKKQSGTGLGLAIASKIVEEHGGMLKIDSKKGEGTTATVYLPLHNPEDNNMCPGGESSPGHLETANTRAE